MNTSQSRLFFAVVILTVMDTRAQFVSSENGFLGVQLMHARAKGPSTERTNHFSQGTMYTRSTALAFNGSLTIVSQDKGFSLGPVFNLALGAGRSSLMVEDPGPGNSDWDGVWSHDFAVYVDWKFGLGINYSLPEQNMNFGIRYANWYLAIDNGFTYNTKENSATIGAFINIKKFGFAYLYANSGIPGVLVNKDMVNKHELEFRYQLRNDDGGRAGVLSGIRMRTQKILPFDKNPNEPNTREAIMSFFIAIQ